ncbi:MAG: nucleoside triphosphate pyrophosphohydrolase [Chloroflexi bacterium]|nr:nucleoside triphosphate pyrophosphohydrolase [Chloroflexota bacterium]
MPVDFGVVAALLSQLPRSERPDGALQIVTADRPFEPNPLAPTLMLNGSPDSGALPAAVIRVYDSRQPVWLLTPDADPLRTTLAEVNGRPCDGLYIPAVQAEAAERSPAGLRRIVERLRVECPWDRKQTHQSLTKYVVEEAYEVVDAIEHHGPNEVAEELGDLLLQVYLQAEIAQQAGTFALDDVVQHLTTKLIRRHPHVFADVQVGGAADVEVNWDALKKAEKAAKGLAERQPSALDGIPRSLPALMMAAELRKRMMKTGFRWHDRASEEAKLDEELAELRAAATPEEAAAELGDVLFVLTGLATWHGTSAEEALRATIAKVDRRFRFVEETARARGQEIADIPLDELLAIWRLAKAREDAGAAPSA